ncbi:MAG TPA: tyrosine-type recombinase/integrase [Candidatus Competibacter sp.]|nr:integrase [Candidatus Competibacteraceae bacterium]HUM95956.1 tyrosine-type recombinase/integrase [Candidatus Competibacter sp.]
MALNDIMLRSAKPRERRYKLFDEAGLYVIVTPEGGKWWRLRYRWVGKEQTLSLGTYPAVSLKQARLSRDAIRLQVREGVNPSEARKAQEPTALGDSFECQARQWHEARAPRWSAVHAGRVLRDLERDVWPWIGKRPVAGLTALDLKPVLARIRDRGAIESAHRVLQVIGQVFRYAVAGGYAERNPAVDLKGWLPSPSRRHFATITEPKAIGRLMRDLDGYQGSLAVRCALRLAPRLMVRPGELRQAEWAEIDLEAALWRIPAAKMKGRQEHLVPLARQCVAILKELQPLTGRGCYLFPSVRGWSRPMSANTVNTALRTLGYASDTLTAHGFRALASTRLNEQGWPPDVIERQLSHAERNKVRSAYNRASYMAERAKMMQAWADDLDALAAGGEVVGIRKKSA